MKYCHNYVAIFVVKATIPLLIVLIVINLVSCRRVVVRPLLLWYPIMPIDVVTMLIVNVST